MRLIVKTLETSKRRDKTLEVLERCKEEYLKDTEFHNDERYIGVWLKLAEFARDPIDTFTFMHTNKIGALCASFYVAWADVLERRNRVGDAEKVLTAGIRRKAQPADDLLAKRKHFETRQFLKVMSKTEEQPAAQATAPAGRPRAAVAKVGAALTPDHQVQRCCEEVGTEPIRSPCQIYWRDGQLSNLCGRELCGGSDAILAGGGDPGERLGYIAGRD